MMETRLCLLFCLIASVDASFFYVTAPNVIRFNNDESILIGILDSPQRNIEVWLQIAGKTRRFSHQRVTVRNENEPKTTTIKVGEDDLFDKKDNEEERPKYVILHATAEGLGTYSTKILLSYRTGYILLQTSKPLYHPNDKVLVRASGMKESLEFAKGWNITMDLITPDGLVYDRVHSKNPEKKFFKNSFKLPPHSELGMWTIKAYYDGQYKTQAKTYFMVQEYVLPTFDVNIEVSEKVILPETDTINVIVTAMYVYGKPVKGIAYLNISTIADDDTIQSYGEILAESLDSDGKGVFSLIDIKKLKDDNLDGHRLLVVARVVELATGHVENASSQQTVFSSRKYRFSFEKSKKYYHPGFPYNLKVTVALANGDTPEGTITVHASSDTDESELEINTGYASFFFNTNGQRGPMTFKVKVGVKVDDEERFESDQYTVDDYDGQSQIQVAQKIDTCAAWYSGERYTKDRKMTITTTSNGREETCTGIMVLLLSRGKYIHNFYFDFATESTKSISDVTQEMLIPEARAVGFYVDKNTKKLVADSEKFSLEPKCRGKGLNLATTLNVEPDTTHDLTITGPPDMDVGLNVMDSALLLLNSTNVLRKNKMFDMMKSHDLGCGEGGGKTAEQVLHDAGLTVVTNAVISQNDLVRESMTCEKHSRKKRSLVADCSETKKEYCCIEGERYAREIVKDPEINFDELDPEITCAGEALRIAKLVDSLNRFKYSHSCVYHFYLKCKETISEELLYDDNVIEAYSALDDSNDFLGALKEFDIDPDSIQARKNFEDSWLFKEVTLNEEGILTTPLYYPSSITTWLVQGVGITENNGFCIAEPVEVVAEKDLFIQLNLPYKATRLEYFEISATIFFYGSVKNNLVVKIYVEGVKGICTGVSHGVTKLIAELEIDRNDAFNVRIPIIPLKAGKFPIKVKALLTSGSKFYMDVIEKKLLVVNEGIEERETITVCLDSINREEDTTCSSSDRVISPRIQNGVQTAIIDLTLPENAIKDTGSAYGYAVSNIMDDVVQTIISGMDNLLRQPTGCGEQTMIYLAPSVYVMSYWKQTNQITEQREKDGNTWIRGGVERELTFRKHDGSYGAWIDRTSSTWLTAFVAKVFCQAHKVVDNAVDLGQHVVKTIEWLHGKTRITGQFYDPLPVIHREMIGQIKENDPSLTAFVLISLLECDVKTGQSSFTRGRAIRYLEGLTDAQYKSDPYLLAITTYALAMARSQKKYHFKDMLMSIKKENKAKNYLYWGDQVAGTASANSIETTAYALLALLKFNDLKSAGKIVRWLTFHRSASGSFKTTQDTVIGLQALSEYNIVTYSADVDLDIRLLTEHGEQFQRLTNENSDLVKKFENIPVKEGPESQVTLTVSGKGSGRLVIDYKYNRVPDEKDVCDFNIGIITIKTQNKSDKVMMKEDKPDFDRKCDLCGCEDDNEGNDDDIENDLEEPAEVRAHNARKRRNADAVEDGKIHCLSFTVASQKQRVHGMSIVDVGLETGVTVMKKDLEALKQKGIIDNYEMPSDGKGFFIMYLDSIKSQPTHITFRLEDNFNGDTRLRYTAAIKVYDYYKPEYECRKFYSTGGKSSRPIELQCEEVDGKKTGMCTCLKLDCPYPGEGEARIEEFRQRKKPAQKLRKYTCNPNKANMAMAVYVSSVNVNFERRIVTVQAVVLENIHQGTAELQEEDEVELYMVLDCADILMEEKKMYYIISKDGEAIKKTDGGTLHRFQMTSSTVIIERRDKKEKKNGLTRLLHQIMEAYVKLMKKGCQE